MRRLPIRPHSESLAPTILYWLSRRLKCPTRRSTQGDARSTTPIQPAGRYSDTKASCSKPDRKTPARSPVSVQHTAAAHEPDAVPCRSPSMQMQSPDSFSLLTSLVFLRSFQFLVALKSLALIQILGHGFCRASLDRITPGMDGARRNIGIRDVIAEDIGLIVVFHHLVRLGLMVQNRVGR